MDMNWYKDRTIRADAGIFRSIFPEQTKNLPRIIVWSIILLLDLSLGIGGAFYYGLLDFDRYSSQSTLRLASGLLLVGIFLLFWLQGKIWYGIVGYFQRRNQLD